MTTTKKPKHPSLDEALLETKRQRIELALAEGCTSARTIAAHLRTSVTRTWRTLRELGYQEIGRGWKRQGVKRCRTNESKTSPQ